MKRWVIARVTAPPCHGEAAFRAIYWCIPINPSQRHCHQPYTVPLALLSMCQTPISLRGNGLCDTW